MEIADICRERGCKTKRLRVSHAFHSHRMDPMLDEFTEVARSVSFGTPQIPIVSNLTGEPVAAERICTAEYWVEHVREPVRFADGIRWLRDHEVRSFLELGPDGVLSAMSRECLEARSSAAEDTAGAVIAEEVEGAAGADSGGALGVDRVVAVPLLRGRRPEAQALLAALAQVWGNGASVIWAGLFKGSAVKRVSLPTYAFQRERYWLICVRFGCGGHGLRRSDRRRPSVAESRRPPG